MRRGARRWGSVALAALACAACEPTVVLRPLADAPGWERCVVAEHPGAVRNVLCEDLDLRLIRAEGLSGAAGVDAVAQSMPGGDATSREILRAGSVAIPIRVHPEFLIAAPRADLLAVCRDSTPALSRCRTALVRVAQQGLPPGVVFPEAQLVLLGHAFTVPDGCERAGERIACRDTGFALDWREQAWSEGAEAALAAGARAARAQDPMAEEEHLPCALLGQLGVGARYVLHRPGGVVYALACVVEHGGVASVAQCQGPAPIAPPYPSPCDRLFVEPK